MPVLIELRKKQVFLKWNNRRLPMGLDISNGLDANCKKPCSYVSVVQALVMKGRK